MSSIEPAAFAIYGADSTPDALAAIKSGKSWLIALTGTALALSVMLLSPQIQFELWLPIEGWNERYLQVGCGGYCGSLNTRPTSGAISSQSVEMRKQRSAAALACFFGAGDDRPGHGV